MDVIQDLERIEYKERVVRHINQLKCILNGRRRYICYDEIIKDLIDGQILLLENLSKDL